MAAVIEVAVARLEQLGATVVDVSLPELQEMQVSSWHEFVGGLQ